MRLNISFPLNLICHIKIHSLWIYALDTIIFLASLCGYIHLRCVNLLCYKHFIHCQFILLITLLFLSFLKTTYTLLCLLFCYIQFHSLEMHFDIYTSIACNRMWLHTLKIRQFILLHIHNTCQIIFLHTFSFPVNLFWYKHFNFMSFYAATYTNSLSIYDATKTLISVYIYAAPYILSLSIFLAIHTHFLSNSIAI